jgi:hypothetical protein
MLAAGIVLMSNKEAYKILLFLLAYGTAAFIAFFATLGRLLRSSSACA